MLDILRTAQSTVLNCVKPVVNLIVMWKKGTGKRALTLFLLIFTPATALAQMAATQETSRWVDSYNSYRATIRELDQDRRTKCEKELYDILTTIDGYQACSNDSECTLVSEEPFGSTVPVRRDASAALLENMKAYRESCNGESIESYYNTELKHDPVCWKNVCMVKTQSK